MNTRTDTLRTILLRMRDASASRLAAAHPGRFASHLLRDNLAFEALLHLPATISQAIERGDTHTACNGIATREVTSAVLDEDFVQIVDAQRCPECGNPVELGGCIHTDRWPAFAAGAADPSFANRTLHATLMRAADAKREELLRTRQGRIAERTAVLLPQLTTEVEMRVTDVVTG